MGIPQGIGRHEPLVVIPAIGAVDDALMIGLDNAKILESGASWNHMGLISFRQLHAHSKGDQLKFPLL